MHRPHRISWFCAPSLLALVLIAASSALASKTQRFVDDSFSEFQGGETTTSTLSDQGYLTLPPLKEKVYDPAGVDVFWDAATASDGRVLLGSGHEGKLFVLDQQSSGTLFAKTSLLEIYSLAVEPDGAVLAGGAPGAAVFRVYSTDDITTFSKTGEKYVWSLKRYPGGDLFAATGPKGKILKIDAKGEATVHCEIKQAKNILDLAFDEKGRMLAVTESKGMLVRIEDKDKAFVLYESDLEEIRRVGVSEDGDIWVAINGQKSAGGGRDMGPPAAGKGPGAAELAAMAGGQNGGGSEDVPSAPAARGPSRRPGGPGRAAPAKIVLLTPEGFVRLSWDPPESPIYDIVLEEGGRKLLVSAGNNGGVYRLDRLGHSEKITAVREKGILRLLRRKDETLLALTNSPAVAYSINPSRPAEGLFASRVLDAQDPVQWGRALIDATLPAGAVVRFSTRTGNTDDPEHHWSEWSEEVEVDGGKSFLVSSPASRRLQYRLRMTAASEVETGWPRVDKVEIPFTTPNQPPAIKDVAISPEIQAPGGPGARPGGMPPPALRGAGMPGVEAPGGAPKGPAAPMGPPRRGGSTGGPEPVDVPADSNAGKMAVSWNAQDPNGDDLRFKVFIRPEKSDVWVLLEEEVEGNQYSIDSMALPDGRYRVRVVATDIPSNLPGLMLTAEAVSDPFEVDNTPPEIQNLSSAPAPKQGVGLGFQAMDETTRITSAQWRINGRDWRFLAPKDGLFDAASEVFEFEIPLDDFEGENSAMITVRATDERGNTGVGLIPVQVGP